MTADIKQPRAIDREPINLRGDLIPQGRYYSRECMAE